MITPPKGMTFCPNCDPCNPEIDEDGRAYTCFACCDSGWVPAGPDGEPVTDDPLEDERERRAFANERNREDDLQWRDAWEFPQ